MKANGAHDELVAAVEARFGLALQKNLHALLERAARALVSQGKASTVAEVAARVRTAKATDAVVVEMQQAATVSETYFFRGQPQLEALCHQVLLKRQKPDRLRVWSAACATGEEAWTLAMLFRRALPKTSLSVLGTDMNENSLTTARAGLYGGRAFREVAASELNDGLEKKADRWSVRADLRALVSFARLNLVTDDYPSADYPLHGHDVIVCRNVLIYMSARQVEKVMKRLTACAAEGAVLALTPAEHSAAVKLDGWESLGRALFRRVAPKRVPEPPAPSAPVRAVARAAWKALEPPPQLSWLERARLAADAQRWAEAEVMLTAAAEQTPDRPEVFLLSSTVRLAQGDVKGAVADAQRALFLNRELAAAELALAQALIKGHRQRDARSHLKRLLKLLEPLQEHELVPGVQETVAVVRAMAQANLGGGR